MSDKSEEIEVAYAEVAYANAYTVKVKGEWGLTTILVDKTTGKVLGSQVLPNTPPAE